MKKRGKKSVPGSEDAEPALASDLNSNLQSLLNELVAIDADDSTQLQRADKLRHRIIEFFLAVNHASLAIKATIAFERLMRLYGDFKKASAMYESALDHAELSNILLTEEMELAEKLATYEGAINAKSSLARQAAIAKHASDPKGSAMAEIKKAYFQMLRGEAPLVKDSVFAKQMSTKYPAVTNEGSIKNRCKPWRQEAKSLKRK